MKNIKNILLLSLVLAGNISLAQIKKTKRAVLKHQVQSVIDTSGAHIGYAIQGLDFTDSFSINGRDHFPMQSVFKFPLAIMILHKVDKGVLSLDQKIHINKSELYPDTWSPLVKDFPDQDVDITLKDLLIYTVSKSDNNACDVLFRLAGGPKAVNTYLQSMGIKGIWIAATEAEMRKGWAVQYTNWCEPLAMLQLLRQFYSGKLLSGNSNRFLMQIMTESQNSANRIKGLLPASAIVAHKTGTSNTNELGITAATNDVGIITLPHGRHAAIVVYISDYKGTPEKGEHIIAALAKLGWDYFLIP